MADFNTAADVRSLAADGPEPPADSFEDRVRSLRLPPERSRRRGAGRWIVVAVVIVLLSGGTGLGCWYYWRIGAQTRLPTAAVAPSPPAESPRPESAPPPDAAAKAAAVPSGGITLESKGYIIAAHQILVSPKVSGMIVYLNVEEGRMMKQGDVLARVESVEYQSDNDNAEANVDLARQQLRELEHGNRPEEIAEAEAELGEAEAQLVQYESDWKRKRELRGSGVLSAQELDAAESQFHATQQRAERLKAAQKLMRLGARQERIAAAKATVRLREAELVKARWRLENCTIRAPITGTILKKNAEEGNIVDAHFFSTSGSTSLCEMADLTDLEVDLEIQERDIARVSVGEQCQVRADAYPERVYKGAVSRLMPIANRGKACISVRVKVSVPTDETGVYLKPEMGAVVTFIKT